MMRDLSSYLSRYGLFTKYNFRLAANRAHGDVTHSQGLFKDFTKIFLQY